MYLVATAEMTLHYAQLVWAAQMEKLLPPVFRVVAPVTGGENSPSVSAQKDPIVTMSF